MTDTSRDAVERLADGLDAIFDGRLGLHGAKSTEAATLRALLAAKEAAEAERDEVIADLKSYMQIANDEASRAQSAEAEADARIRELEQGVARPDVWASHMCRELRQAGYLVPYERMMLTMGTVGSALAPDPVTVQEAARVLLEAEATEDRHKIYAACENRVKVYKFFAALSALAGQGGE